MRDARSTRTLAAARPLRPIVDGHRATVGAAIDADTIGARGGVASRADPGDVASRADPGDGASRRTFDATA